MRLQYFARGCQTYHNQLQVALKGKSSLELMEAQVCVCVCVRACVRACVCPHSKASDIAVSYQHTARHQFFFQSCTTNSINFSRLLIYYYVSSRGVRICLAMFDYYSADELSQKNAFYLTFVVDNFDIVVN